MGILMMAVGIGLGVGMYLRAGVSAKQAGMLV